MSFFQFDQLKIIKCVQYTKEIGMKYIKVLLVSASTRILCCSFSAVISEVKLSSSRLISLNSQIFYKEESKTALNGTKSQFWNVEYAQQTMQSHTHTQTHTHTCRHPNTQSLPYKPIHITHTHTHN